MVVGRIEDGLAENEKIRPMEGRRDSGIGEESRDEVRPNKIVNALPGTIFAHGEHGTGRGCGWLGVMRTPGRGVSVIL